MVYNTRKDAQLALSRFVPALRALHSIERATVNGKIVGWCLVFHPITEGRMF